jgi:hypothetical protein
MQDIPPASQAHGDESGEALVREVSIPASRIGSTAEVLRQGHAILGNHAAVTRRKNTVLQSFQERGEAMLQMDLTEHLGQMAREHVALHRDMAMGVLQLPETPDTTELRSTASSSLTGLMQESKKPVRLLRELVEVAGMMIHHPPFPQVPSTYTDTMANIHQAYSDIADEDLDHVPADEPMSSPASEPSAGEGEAQGSLWAGHWIRYISFLVK